MAIVLSYRVKSQVLGGGAMLLLHLFKLPHYDTERNQVPTLLWYQYSKYNVVPVF